MANIIINGTDYSTPLLMNDAERISYGNTTVADALDNMPKYKKFTGTTDGYGQLIFGSITGEIVSVFAYGDRLFATLQSNGIARITNQTGAVVTNTSVTVMIGYI